MCSPSAFKTNTRSGMERLMQTFPPLPLCSAKCIRKHTAERLSCVFCPMLMPLHIVCTNKTLLPRPPAPSVGVKMQTLLISHFTARDFRLSGKTGTLSRAPGLFGLHVHRTVLLPLQRSQRTSENIGPASSRTLRAYVRHGWCFVETETSSNLSLMNPMASKSSGKLVIDCLSPPPRFRQSKDMHRSFNRLLSFLPDQLGLISHGGLLTPLELFISGGEHNVTITYFSF